MVANCPIVSLFMSDTSLVMQEAAELLSDVKASYEYPGFISVEQNGVEYAFGDTNGDYTYNLADCTEMDCDIPPLTSEATATELAAWIKSVLSTQQ